MLAFETFLILLPALLFGYAYVLYPAILWIASRRSKPLPHPADPANWPSVTVSVPVYNEIKQIRGLLDSLTSLDYPRERLQILVISDCSSDGTDEVAREYAS